MTQPAPLRESLVSGGMFKDCDVCPEMVVIPPGNFMMRNSHPVTIARAFAVGKTEVTFAQWDACVAEGGCTHRPDDGGWGRGSQPVINVNWFDAKEYVGWLSRRSGKRYRLPTAAEWEYAARAGTTTAYYWGDSDADICQYANVGVHNGGEVNRNYGCGTGRPAPVASKKPNAFGLYDMLGNAIEWMEDCFNDMSIDGIPGDGSARTSGNCGVRVLSGGAWGGGAASFTQLELGGAPTAAAKLNVCRFCRHERAFSSWSVFF